jgi:outer membrane scaffolding protein for murein synthesis (MipA/OmpV family)
MKKTTPLTIALLTTALASAPSFAQYPQGPKEDWQFTFGIGTLYMPAFTGSKDYQLMAFPNLKVEYKDRLFVSLFEGVGYNIIKTPSWRAGPIAKFDFGRQEDDSNPFRLAGKKSNALRGLGDIDPTAELGGFVEYSYDPISFKVEVRQGVGGHKGLIGEVGLDYTDMVDVFGPPIFFGVGPRATFADSHYNNAYFGITQAQSIKSGLARYSASSGLVSYGVGGFAMMQVSDGIALNLFAGYDRLGDQADKSPLIKERGSVNQFTLGIGVSYQFGY